MDGRPTPDLWGRPQTPGAPLGRAGAPPVLRQPLPPPRGSVPPLARPPSHRLPQPGLALCAFLTTTPPLPSAPVDTSHRPMRGILLASSWLLICVPPLSESRPGGPPLPHCRSQRVAATLHASLPSSPTHASDKSPLFPVSPRLCPALHLGHHHFALHPKNQSPASCSALLGPPDSLPGRKALGNRHCRQGCPTSAPTRSHLEAPTPTRPWKAPGSPGPGAL